MAVFNGAVVDTPLTGVGFVLTIYDGSVPFNVTPYEGGFYFPRIGGLMPQPDLFTYWRSRVGNLMQPQSPYFFTTARQGTVREVLQNTAVNIYVFMRDLGTGLGQAGYASTMVVNASKNGANGSVITPAVTDLGGSLGAGWYVLALTNVHTNTLGGLVLHVTAPGAAPNDDVQLNVIAVNKNDVVRMGLTSLPNAAVNTAGGFPGIILDALLSDHSVVGSMADGVAIAAGLLQGNFYIDQTDNSSPFGQTAARMRVFRNSADAAAATDGGSGEGEFATFIVSTSYVGPNKVKTHRVVRQ